MENANTRPEFIGFLDQAHAVITRMESERGIPHAVLTDDIIRANDRIEFLANTPVTVAPVADAGRRVRGTPQPIPAPVTPTPAPVTRQEATKPPVSMPWQPVGLGRAIIAASGGKTPSTRPPEPPQTTKLTGLSRAIAAAEKQARQQTHNDL